MEIRILGAHNIESRGTRCVSLLIDDRLAVDAGALTSGLDFAAQRRLEAVLLTHQHYDHVRDIPALGMNLMLMGEGVDVYAPEVVYEALVGHVLNGRLYPNLFQRPPGKPALRYHKVVPGEELVIGGYRVLPVPVDHAVPTVGYQVTAADGGVLFYTSDTGPGLAGAWARVSPGLLIIECTAPNRFAGFARRAGHLTPELLKQELDAFRELKDYLPEVVLVHMNPLEEVETWGEIAAVAAGLGVSIRLGEEGMRLRVPESGEVD